MKAVEFQGLEVQYGDMPALKAASGSFESAAMTAIVGPNGTGKSTLLKAALGLIPASGRVTFFGKPLAEMRARVAYVPQRASVDWDFPVRVIDVVVQGLYRELGLLGRLRLSHRRRALDCLERVGMADYASRQIGALSGGQQQRVFLARALAQNADLYLLDEPFAGVDAATESAIIAVLKSLRDQGRSVVAVHHDLATVPAYFDRVLLLNRQVQAEGPVAETFTPAALARLYGGLLPQLP